jgi:head-tail adaptor
MVNAGQLRHQVIIQQRSTTQDAAGEPAHTWTTFATRRAEQMSTPGGERFASAQRNARVPTLWRLRWLEGVTPGMRLKWGDRVYNIQSAENEKGLGEKLILTTEELVGETP